MAPRTPMLTEIMFRGFHSGFRWETKGYKTHNTDGSIVHTHRRLLHHPHSTHIAKTLFRGLGSRTKSVIGECLSDIYNFAADNVHLCKYMEPKEFWAYAKNSWEWSANFRDDAFWAFTYKLFHARALYLHTVHRTYRPKGHPLIDALDHFQDAFYNLYAPKSTSTPTFTNTLTEDEISEGSRIFKSYFRYTWHGSEGDGTDRTVETIVQDENHDPNGERYIPNAAPPAEFMENNVGFYFDLGPRNPRHGHKNAYQEIEDALKKAEEEDLRAKQQQQQATGIEEDIAMMDVDQREDHDMDDIGMGGLEI
ncbi:hypothetical protein F4860DRAFT_521383 [Xylaria cubensis]|nr:hypothetical protein F4860DRAFT_521383 [Xylaria cubensis]